MAVLILVTMKSSHLHKNAHILTPFLHVISSFVHKLFNALIAEDEAKVSVTGTGAKEGVLISIMLIVDKW